MERIYARKKLQANRALCGLHRAPGENFATPASGEQGSSSQARRPAEESARRAETEELRAKLESQQSDTGGEDTG